MFAFLCVYVLHATRVVPGAHFKIFHNFWEQCWGISGSMLFSILGVPCRKGIWGSMTFPKLGGVVLTNYQRGRACRFSLWGKTQRTPPCQKYYAVVNLLCVVNLLSHSDLLSRRTLCGHHFPGNCRHFSSQRRVCGVVDLGNVGVVIDYPVVFSERLGPLGSWNFSSKLCLKNCEKCRWKPFIKNLLMGLFLMGCFAVDFQEGKLPLKTNSVNSPLRSRKGPLQSGKGPLRPRCWLALQPAAKWAVFGVPAMVENSPSKKAH